MESRLPAEILAPVGSNIASLWRERTAAAGLREILAAAELGFEYPHFCRQQIERRDDGRLMCRVPTMYPLNASFLDDTANTASTALRHVAGGQNCSREPGDQAIATWRLRDTVNKSECPNAGQAPRVTRGTEMGV